MANRPGYVHLGVEVSLSLRQRLEAAARKRFTNKSSIIRQALDEFLTLREREGNGNEGRKKEQDNER